MSKKKKADPKPTGAEAEKAKEAGADTAAAAPKSRKTYRRVKSGARTIHQCVAGCPRAYDGRDGEERLKRFQAGCATCRAFVTSKEK